MPNLAWPDHTNHATPDRVGAYQSFEKGRDTNDKIRGFFALSSFGPK